MADERTEQLTLADNPPPNDIEESGDDKGLTLFQRLKDLYREDLSHANSWRKKAHQDRNYYDGHQWSEEDQQILRNQQRPCITMNRIKVLVNAVVGSEINNRREVQYYPREVGDAVANELLTNAGEWFRDQAQAEDDESVAFQDCVITGMGWIDTRLDFETSADGEPVVRRLDPFKMIWDCHAVRQNLSDAQRVWYVDDKPLAVARKMFPDIDPVELHATWALDSERPEADEDIHDQTMSRYYLGGQERFAEEDSAYKLVRIVECRYFETEEVYQAVDPETGEIREIDKKILDEALKIVPDIQYRKISKIITKRVFLGKKVLGEADRPAVPEGTFGWECITGYFDNKHQHYHGLVRDLIDPQNWTNKFFSQTMYLLNSQSKGGIMAERGAFDDDRQATESFTRADAITWMKPGSLSANKVLPKPAAQFPAGFWSLFLESKDELSQISGLSPEFIGTREVNQPGVLESQRRQSTLNLLAALFNSLRRYRKRQGKIVLYLIQNYLSDGRLIRIVGEGKARYVPLTREAVANAEYDIIVDDAPTSPNEKERTFGIMQQMLPMLKDFITPEIVIEFLRYSPLPATLVEKIIEQAQKAQEQQGQSEQPDPAQQQAQTKMALMQADVQAKQQKSEIDTQSKMIDLFVKSKQAEQELLLGNAKLQQQQEKIASEVERNRIRAMNAENSRLRSASLNN